ncbi:hypothetical protein [uncultured Porphyromonas sp.]|uniref:hypothetical protein n=1 Tax=uncultured Porphyromonas sp. TaxID=159274 RepID=UPI00262E3B6B|nr:hypothetical protein [uncultured Porphyromonas sp.]
MNKLHKEPYQAPEACPFELPQTLHFLVGFSYSGDIEDPDTDDDWGTGKIV